MKLVYCLLATTLATASAFAQVGVSVSLGQPGFYGRVDIGDAPPPRVLYRQPVVVGRVESVEPIYLHVPPEHARRWRRHCGEYQACGRRVYFVRDDWYDNVYVPHYREHHGRDRDRRGDHDDDRGRDHGRHDKGRGHGYGHDKDR